MICISFKSHPRCADLLLPSEKKCVKFNPESSENGDCLPDVLSMSASQRHKLPVSELEMLLYQKLREQTAEINELKSQISVNEEKINNFLEKFSIVWLFSNFFQMPSKRKCRVENYSHNILHINFEEWSCRGYLSLLGRSELWPFRRLPWEISKKVEKLFMVDINSHTGKIEIENRYKYILLEFLGLF